MPAVNESLESVSQENLNAAIDELFAGGGAVASDSVSDVAYQAGTTATQFADMLSAEASSLSEDSRLQLESQADALRESTEARDIVTSEQIDSVLEQSL